MAELRDRIDRSRLELERAIADVVSRPPGFAVVSSNGWSVQQQVMHIAAWEASVTGLLRGEPRGPAMRLDPAIFVEGWRPDAINDVLMATHGEMPLDEVLAWFAASHAGLLHELDQLGDADLFRRYDSFMTDYGEYDAPIIRWIAGDTYDHYAEHLALLR